MQIFGKREMQEDSNNCVKQPNPDKNSEGYRKEIIQLRL